jgi:hypothetical protein
MATGSYSVNMNIGGLSISQTITRTAEGGMQLEIPVPAGAAGTLTTRTDNETGSLTMTSGGHGITTGSKIDLYWAGGARYGITVGTVSGSVVPIGADNSGTGDNLPTAATAIVADMQIPFNASIDGDSLSLIGMRMKYASATETAQSHAGFLDAADDSIASFTLEANQPRTWDIEGGDTNPFTGDPITDGVLSNGSATNAATFQINWLVDATP